MFYIYIFYLDEIPLYAGKTKNFINRSKEHLQRGEEYMFCFSHVVLYELESEFYTDILETYFINKLKPKFNEQKNIKNITEEELKSVEFLLSEIINTKKEYQFDFVDSIFQKRELNLMDLKFSLIKNLSKKLLENYPDKFKEYDSNDLYNFFFNTEDGKKIFLDEYYIKLRKQWFTDAQFKQNKHRFRGEIFLDNKNIIERG